MEREPIICVVERVIKRLATQVIATRYIRHAVYDITGQKITDDRLKVVVDEGSSEFERAVVEEVASVIKDDCIEEKIDQLWDIITKTDPNANGWRPTGVPKLDVFGHIRSPLLEHEERLKQIKQKLLHELQERKAYLKKLRTKVDKLDDHNLGASAASALQF
uniref:Uncharacterized protein n=1 Tax=Parascaris univalens TaxID=6257 RepID=A0A915C1S5_PARUN